MSAVLPGGRAPFKEGHRPSAGRARARLPPRLEGLARGEQPVRIVAMLSRHVQILLRTKHLEQQRLPAADLARSLGVAPYFLGGYRSQARELPVNVLWHRLSRLMAADAQVKSCGKAQQRTALASCLCEITDTAVPPPCSDCHRCPVGLT